MNQTLKTLGRWLAAALALCAGAGAASAQALTDCRVAGLRNTVKCGVVQRALDPARPGGPKIEVHYVVVPAMARRKLPDPVFLLAGGPGQSAIDLAPQTMPLFSRLNNRRDIVFVDQRGTGESAPLDCADPKRETLDDQSDSEQQIRLLMQCQADLMKRPYIKAPSDLGFFTTTLAMQDLDAVRRQLGAKQIDLVGVSYGTRAALEYMRQFPDAVRRAVLDSVAPPDMVLPASFSTDGQAAFDSLLAACERQPECSKAYPKLRADWAALLKSLPKPAVAPQPLSGKPEHFTLTREMVLGAVRGALYNPAMAAALPAAISEAAAGRYEGLVGMGSLLGSRHGLQLAMGMHFSVVCAEDAPLMDRATDVPGADFGTDFAVAICVAAALDDQAASLQGVEVLDAGCGQGLCGRPVGLDHQDGQIAEMTFTLGASVLELMVWIVMAAGGAAGNTGAVQQGWAAIVVFMHMEAMRAGRQAMQIELEGCAGV